MGGGSRYIEEAVGGVALFVNADAGDIGAPVVACAGAATQVRQAR